MGGPALPDGPCPVLERCSWDMPQIFPVMVLETAAVWCKWSIRCLLWTREPGQLSLTLTLTHLGSLCCSAWGLFLSLALGLPSGTLCNLSVSASDPLSRPCTPYVHLYPYILYGLMEKFPLLVFQVNIFTTMLNLQLLFSPHSNQLFSLKIYYFSHI